MAVNPHIQLVSTAGWQLQKGAVPAREALRCLVKAAFADGYEAEVEATASAWSEQAVHVYFPHPDSAVSGPMYRVWMPVERVRRLPPNEAPGS